MNKMITLAPRVRFLLLAAILALATISALQPFQLIFGIAFVFTNIFLIVAVQLFGLRIALPAGAVIYGTAILLNHEPVYVLIFLLEMVWIGLWPGKKSVTLLKSDAYYWLVVGLPLTLAAFYVTGPFSFTEFFLLYAITASNGLFNTLVAEMLECYALRPIIPERDRLGITLRRVLFHLSVTMAAIPFLMNLIIGGWNSFDASKNITLQMASNTANSIMRELGNWKEEDVLGVRLEGAIQIGYLEEIINRNSTKKLFDITIANDNRKILATNNTRHFDDYLEAEMVTALDDHFRIEVPRGSRILPTGQWRDAHYVYSASMDNMPLIISVSVPMSVYQEAIFKDYISQILYMLGSVFLASLLALAINRWLGESLRRLANTTTNLPAKLKQKDAPEWPKSGIAEIDSLTLNFKSMSGNLLQMLDKADEMNDQLRSSEEMLHQLAYYDSLTGLPNRLQFQHMLGDKMTWAAEHGECLAVLFLDLNRFKQINDTLGHAAGDALLAKVAERFAGLLNERCSVFRLGGDEFVFLLQYDSVDAPAALAEQLCRLFDTPIELEGSYIYVAASIGISLFPEHGKTQDEIVRKADLAMYVAKEQGTSSYYFFNQQKEDSLNEKMVLENGMRSALMENQFFLVYQPKMGSAAGLMTGYEALLRWKHPSMGIVPPNRFIPLAESSGMILDIDMWALREACRQTKEWQDKGYPKLPVSVNLSAKHFGRSNISAKVRSILEETGLDPSSLGLEITESVFIEELEPAIEQLTMLREMGIEILLDDFGTGYSSLSQLQRLPISVVKLDRTFIQQTEANEAVSSVVKGIIGLAHGMGLRVVAEGIETEQEKAIFTALKCEELQGFLFSRPLEPLDFEAYMRLEQRLIQKGMQEI